MPTRVLTFYGRASGVSIIVWFVWNSKRTTDDARVRRGLRSNKCPALGVTLSIEVSVALVVPVRHNKRPTLQGWRRMTDRRDACITFQRMTRAQLPTSEYTLLRQLFQKLTSGLSNAKDVHESICAILRRHNATELLALFERLVAMGTTETSLRLLRQPCGVHVKEGAPLPPVPQTSRAFPELVCPRLRTGAGRLVQQPVILLLEPSDTPPTDTPQDCVVSLVLPGLP